MNEKDLTRLIGKVEKTDSCWIWHGARKPSGYGNFYMSGKYFSAHRASYMLHFGDIENGLIVMHSCDNPSCVNPSHLFSGTPKDNVQDMIKKGRAIGPTKGSEHTPCCKLTWVQVREIRGKLSQGLKQNSLAREYGVSNATIHNIQAKKTWIERQELNI